MLNRLQVVVHLVGGAVCKHFAYHWVALLEGSSSIALILAQQFAV